MCIQFGVTNYYLETENLVQYQLEISYIEGKEINGTIICGHALFSS